MSSFKVVPHGKNEWGAALLDRVKPAKTLIVFRTQAEAQRLVDQLNAKEVEKAAIPRGITQLGRRRI